MAMAFTNGPSTAIEPKHAIVRGASDAVTASCTATASCSMPRDTMRDCTTNKIVAIALNDSQNPADNTAKGSSKSTASNATAIGCSGELARAIDRASNHA